MMGEVELGKLYKTKYRSLNMGEYIYTLSRRYIYTEGMNLVAGVKVIQIDEGFENRVVEIYEQQIKDYYNPVEE